MIKFNEELHKYTLDNKELISVTTLLSKHGLSTNYDNVDPNILKNKAKFGSDIHKELERYLHGRITYQELSKISKTAIDLLKDFTIIESERMVYNDLIAGTMDLLALDNHSNEITLIDFKTTYELNVNSVSWQLSLYQYLYGASIERLSVIWLDKSINSFVIKDIPMKSKEMVEKLIECERKGELYIEAMEIIPNDIKDVVAQTFSEYEVLTQRLKELEEQKTTFVEIIKGAMKENGIKTFENDYLKITYVEPQVRVSYDYKKYLELNNIKLDEQDLDEIRKETHVKDSVRITMKGSK